MAEACARDAGLRHRLEQAPENVLREYGITLTAGVAAVVEAILGGDLSEADLIGLAGGFEHVNENA